MGSYKEQVKKKILDLEQRIAKERVGFNVPRGE